MTSKRFLAPVRDGPVLLCQCVEYEIGHPLLYGKCEGQPLLEATFEEGTACVGCAFNRESLRKNGGKVFQVRHCSAGEGSQCPHIQQLLMCYQGD